MTNHRQCFRGWAAAALILLSSGFFVGACSFENSLSGLECEEENATRAGEVCRDGYWRIEADAGLDAGPDAKEDGGGPDLDALSDTPTPPDVDPTPDADTTPDADSGPDAEDCAATSIQCGQACVDPAEFPEDLGEGKCDTGLLGICSTGLWECAGETIECVPENQPVAEVCGGDDTGNGFDDDCDGEADEDCAECVEGTTRRSYSGADGTLSADRCQEQIQECLNGSWQITQDEVLPAQELCNDDGIDEDCDGDDDNGCVCLNGDQRECGSDEGLCEFGTETCVGGQWSGVCEGGQGPVAELCNDLDDDCDGQVDEDFGTLGDDCSVGVGECENDGEMVCTADGSATECNVSPLSPTTYYHPDADGDGYGDEDNTLAIAACTQPAGYVLNNTDCDDTNPITHPNAREICDGENNNCNRFDGDSDDNYSSSSTSASQWCRDKYPGELKCEEIGPTYCCANDDNICDTETVCNDGIDHDVDGDVDCDDTDCLGLACNLGTGISGVCVSIGDCQPL